MKTNSYPITQPPRQNAPRKRATPAGMIVRWVALWFDIWSVLLGRCK